MWSRFLGVLIASAVSTSAVSPIDTAADPSYDHQTTTYLADHKPLVINPSSETPFTVSPIFSPTSIIPLTSLLQNATTSIDIGTPGWGSWSGCTAFNMTTCLGCTPSKMRLDAFPLFQVVLNKIHEGVKVRILTNDYGVPPCSGMMGPLTFLKLAGAEVKYFDTVTFWHAKYLAVDGKKVSVSSINFSYTSFMENREAGGIIENPEVVSWLNDRFTDDFDQAIPFPVTQTYSSEALAIVHDKTPVPVQVPPLRVFKYCSARTPAVAPIDVTSGTVTVWAGPDYAYSTVMAELEATTRYFRLYMYQVTHPDLCDFLIKTWANRDITMEILVSHWIYDAADRADALVCYNRMNDAGIPIMLTPDYCYTFAHQKYWIRDNKSVNWSTGNWSPSDYQPGSDEFVPFSAGAAWRKTNRDFTVTVSESDDLVAEFASVFDNDFKQGKLWTTNNTLAPFS